MFGKSLVTGKQYYERHVLCSPEAIDIIDSSIKTIVATGSPVVTLGVRIDRKPAEGGEWRVHRPAKYSTKFVKIVTSEDAEALVEAEKNVNKARENLERLCIAAWNRGKALRISKGDK